MSPPIKFQLVFSLVAGAIMVTFMTFIITAVNLGFGPHFLAAWAQAFVVAYSIGVPTLFFVSPIARKITGRILGFQP